MEGTQILGRAGWHSEDLIHMTNWIGTHRLAVTDFKEFEQFEVRAPVCLIADPKETVGFLEYPIMICSIIWYT